MPVAPSIPSKARKVRLAPSAPARMGSTPSTHPTPVSVSVSSVLSRSAAQRHVPSTTSRQLPSAPRRSTLSARSNPTRTRLDPHSSQRDRLGTLVSELTTAYSNSASWEDFVKNFRGRSYLSPDLHLQDHPATELLKKWRDEGVPADTSSPPWTLEQKDHCVERGCHPSANLHAEFLREEMADFIDKKFWAVLPYDLVRDLPSLKLSPAAIKDERDRRPRFLADHSWPWNWQSVNETTIPHAPPEAMQFGGTLPRLLYQARHANPKF